MAHKKSKTIQNITLNLPARIEKAFQQHNVTAKGMRDFRLCVIIRLGISNDTYLRMMKSDNFNPRQLSVLSQIMGCTVFQLWDNKFIPNPHNFNLSIPEWTSEIEIEK